VKDHSRFISWCLATPWALLPARITAYTAVLEALSRGETPAPQAAAPRGTNKSSRSGSIAVIPIYGTIVPRLGQLDMCEEGTSTQQISNMLADANADPSVAQILQVIDSPGGAVYGVPELAAEIANSKKPVTSFATSMAASAAYWIGAAGNEFFMSPSAEVGSIGVWMAHQDYSKAMKKSGVKTTLVSAGPFKVEANPYEPLSEEALAHLQSRVNDYYNMFVRGVAQGRKVSVDTVLGGMGQGRCYGADQSRKENMVDDVLTLDQVVARMQSKMKSAAPSRLARAQRELQIAG